MPTSRWFSRAALMLAAPGVIAACSSDTPTSPPIASQSSIVSAPTIALSRTSLHLCYPSRPASTRSCYSSGLVSISNTAGGVLNWTSTKSRTWLKRSPTYGTAPSTMKVSVDGTGLAPGLYYYGYINVWATGATNSPQRVAVYMQRW